MKWFGAFCVLHGSITYQVIRGPEDEAEHYKNKELCDGNLSMIDGSTWIYVEIDEGAL